MNEGLRGYIDGILMNIMEKYPELLEVRKWPELSGYNHWTYIEKDKKSSLNCVIYQVSFENNR